MQEEIRKKYYAIGEVSAICDVSIKTLRYYDKIGLLVPAYRKDDSKYRYYTHEQILLVYLIKRLRHLGMSMNEIRDAIRNNGSREMVESIQARMVQISEEISSLNQQYIEGQMLLERLSNGRHTYAAETSTGWSTEQIKMETILPEQVIFTRRVMHNYRNAEVSVDRWFEIFDMLSRRKQPADGRVILTYHNAPLQQFFEQDCDLEISMRVSGEPEGKEYKTFGGFLAATALHIGRNEDIIHSHVRTIQWLRQKGYEVSGPVSEEYLISPIDIQNEDEHVTKIIIPVCREENK